MGYQLVSPSYRKYVAHQRLTKKFDDFQDWVSDRERRLQEQRELEAECELATARRDEEFQNKRSFYKSPPPLTASVPASSSWWTRKGSVLPAPVESLRAAAAPRGIVDDT
eukprot:CAMPEP_0176462326 /NCGR_PEP_ID=MMETSP0127-20121128/35193_1 /TAXON_ID=938130 /ORGANISM="Platyophrya macrostoma, Strain WH" /LENGTH=109 /DNA_ID=CAMNT_0017854207 /DNA_START=138 /DNA_END=463 /DNA_ORIENTATION=-